MWYVAQVYTGREQVACDLIERFADPATYEECFVPRYRSARKQNGQYVPYEEVLFSGYVIIVTESIDRFRSELIKVPVFTKLLGNDATLLPLDHEEEAWISAFTRKEHRTIDMSRGVVEGGKVVVTDGPLVRREGLIKKINRRKRLATLELSMLGRTVEVKVGLELVRSKP